VRLSQRVAAVRIARLGAATQQRQRRLETATVLLQKRQQQEGGREAELAPGLPCFEQHGNGRFRVLG
jgi:hypothetical protein